MLMADGCVCAWGMNGNGVLGTGDPTFPGPKTTGTIELIALMIAPEADLKKMDQKVARPRATDVRCQRVGGVAEVSRRSRK